MKSLNLLQDKWQNVIYLHLCKFLSENLRPNSCILCVENMPLIYTTEVKFCIYLSFYKHRKVKHLITYKNNEFYTKKIIFLDFFCIFRSKLPS